MSKRMRRQESSAISCIKAVVFNRYKANNRAAALHFVQVAQSHLSQVRMEIVEELCRAGLHTYHEGACENCCCNEPHP